MSSCVNAPRELGPLQQRQLPRPWDVATVNATYATPAVALQLARLTRTHYYEDALALQPPRLARRLQQQGVVVGPIALDLARYDFWLPRPGRRGANRSPRSIDGGGGGGGGGSSSGGQVSSALRSALDAFVFASSEHNRQWAQVTTPVTTICHHPSVTSCHHICPHNRRWAQLLWSADAPLWAVHTRAAPAERAPDLAMDLATRAGNHIYIW